MRDKNNKEIKVDDICITYDRFGGGWVAPIHNAIIKFENGGKEKLVFDSNYTTVIHDYWSKELEIIGNKKDNSLLLILCCNKIVYYINHRIWRIKKYLNNK